MLLVVLPCLCSTDGVAHELSMNLRIRATKRAVQLLLSVITKKAVNTYSIRGATNWVSLCLYRITTLHLHNSNIYWQVVSRT